MKQLLSQLTMLLLSLLVLLLTVNRESASKRPQGGREVRSLQPAEKVKASSPVKVPEDTMGEDQSFKLMPLRNDILTGKSMYVWIY